MKKITYIIFLLQIILLGANTAQSQTIISGTIHTPSDRMIKNVHVYIANSQQDFTVAVTSTDGSFSQEVPAGGVYEVYFTKEEAALNGVSTFDLVLTSKHILNIETYDSFYSILAMDTNGNQAVSVFDILITRQILLGMINNFPVSSWKFLEAMPDPTEFSTPPPVNTLTVEVEDGTTKTLDIIGVKTGDVNDSASVN